MSAQRLKIASLLLVAACAAAAAGVTYATRPIRIGVALSPDTSLGHEAILALRYYQQRHPRIGWRPVELVVRAPTLAPADLRRAYAELDRAGVSVVVGAAISEAGLTLADEAQRTGLPCFSVAASTDALQGREDGFFRLVAGTELVGRLAARHLQPRFARVAVLTGATNRAYTESLGEAVARSLGPAAASVVSLADEEAALEQVRRWAPDAAYLIVSPDVLLRLTPRLRAQHPGIAILSSDWGLFGLPLYSPEALEGVTFVTQNGPLTPRYQELLAGYEEAHDYTPAHTAAYSFSLLDILYQGLAEAGDDRAALARWLATPRVYDYAYGRVRLDAAGDAVRELHHLLRVEQGRLRVVERMRVAEFEAGP